MSIKSVIKIYGCILPYFLFLEIHSYCILQKHWSTATRPAAQTASVLGYKLPNRCEQISLLIQQDVATWAPVYPPPNKKYSKKHSIFLHSTLEEKKMLSVFLARI